MISNGAYKLLKWMKEQDSWMSPSEISQKYKNFDERSLRAITDAKFLDKQFSYDESSWVKYRISESGRSYLEDVAGQQIREVREWISFLLPFLTFLGGLLLSDPVKSLVRWILELFS